jgi:hypothetical protein
MSRRKRPHTRDAQAAIKHHRQKAAKGWSSHMGRPTALATGRTTAIQEIPIPESMKAQQVLGGAEPHLRAFRFGADGQVLVGCAPLQGWHLSISFPDRYPTWDEIAEARYRLIPDAANMAIVLPPRSEYVNIHPNCFHLFEVVDREDHFRALAAATVPDSKEAAEISA